MWPTRTSRGSFGSWPRLVPGDGAGFTRGPWTVGWRNRACLVPAGQPWGRAETSQPTELPPARLAGGSCRPSRVGVAALRRQRGHSLRVGLESGSALEIRRPKRVGTGGGRGGSTPSDGKASGVVPGTKGGGGRSASRFACSRTGGSGARDAANRGSAIDSARGSMRGRGMRGSVRCWSARWRSVCALSRM
jgi:hypothetical protein